MNKEATILAKSIGMLIVLSMLSACIEQKHEFPLGCKLEDLLLDVSELPAGSELSTKGQPLPDSTINSSGSSFYLESHLVDNSIFWYSTERYSVRKYEEEVAAARSVNNNSQSMPVDLVTNSLLADQHEIVCGNDVLAFRCIYVGQYANYVTVLNAEINKDVLSSKTFSGIVRILDKKISSCR